MEVNEFEGLNPLQTFLLVLVKAGLASPYDLLKNAGLGVGLTSPALKRLEKGGLLKSTPGPRRRQRYAITEEGELRLNEAMKSDQAYYWQFGMVDAFDSLPRGIILAWLYSGSAQVHHGIARAADHLATMSSITKTEAEILLASMHRQQAEIVEHSTSSAKGKLIATTYRWMKAEADATLFGLQAEAVRGLHDRVASLPDVPLISAAT